MSDIYIYGTIGEDWFGDGFTAADMRDGLEAADGGDVTIHINSGGGDVFEATAISSLVSQYREANPAATVETIVEGLAASAASYLGLTAGRVLIAPGAMMMVHDPSGGCYGQAQDMRRMADALDAVRDSIATLYARKAGGSPEAWAERMAAETWLTAEEAVELELADAIAEDRAAIAASVDPRIRAAWRHAPEALLDGAGDGPAPDAGDGGPTIQTSEPEPVENDEGAAEAEAAEAEEEASSRAVIVGGDVLVLKQ